MFYENKFIIFDLNPSKSNPEFTISSILCLNISILVLVLLISMICCILIIFKILFASLLSFLIIYLMQSRVSLLLLLFLRILLITELRDCNLVISCPDFDNWIANLNIVSLIISEYIWTCSSFEVDDVLACSNFSFLVMNSPFDWVSSWLDVFVDDSDVLFVIVDNGARKSEDLTDHVRQSFVSVWMLNFTTQSLFHILIDCSLDAIMSSSTCQLTTLFVVPSVEQKSITLWI